MKQSKMILVFLFVALNTSGQKLDSARVYNRNPPKDTVSNNLSLTMSKQDWNELLMILQTADRKQQTINLWLKTIVGNLKPVKNEKKD